MKRRIDVLTGQNEGNASEQPTATRRHEAGSDERLPIGSRQSVLLMENGGFVHVHRSPLLRRHVTRLHHLLVLWIRHLSLPKNIQQLKKSQPSSEYAQKHRLLEKHRTVKC